MNTTNNTSKLVILGLMTGILLLMAYTPLGYLNIGPLAITFNVIPVAIAAITTLGFLFHDLFELGCSKVIRIIRVCCGRITDAECCLGIRVSGVLGCRLCSCRRCLCGATCLSAAARCHAERCHCC